ncbi:GNVR domain-containing protein [Rhodococcus sp. NPDC076796]|uniref:YveK family protein n=1 Tax=Rhodococcus sp. NPDC076796 TaxID=3154859 RepID=UPI00344E9372
MIAPTGVPTLKDYGRILLSGWAAILAAAVLSAGVAWLATQFVEPTYTAASRVFVTAPGPTSPRALTEGNRSSLVRVESYVVLATGEQVLRRVIASQGLPVEPDELKQDITVVPTGGSALIEISVVNSDADQARDIANSVAVQLIKLVGEIDLGANGAVSEVSLIDAATTPDSVTTPKPTSNMILGGVMGSILGSVLVLAFGIARDSIDHRDQVENIVKQATAHMRTPAVEGVR